jgi:hypothetical protein
MKYDFKTIAIIVIILGGILYVSNPGLFEGLFASYTAGYGDTSVITHQPFAMTQCQDATVSFRTDSVDSIDFADKWIAVDVSGDGILDGARWYQTSNTCTGYHSYESGGGWVLSDATTPRGDVVEYADYGSYYYVHVDMYLPEVCGETGWKRVYFQTNVPGDYELSSVPTEPYSSNNQETYSGGIVPGQYVTCSAGGDVVAVDCVSESIVSVLDDCVLNDCLDQGDGTVKCDSLCNPGDAACVDPDLKVECNVDGSGFVYASTSDLALGEGMFCDYTIPDIVPEFNYYCNVQQDGTGKLYRKLSGEYVFQRDCSLGCSADSQACATCAYQEKECINGDLYTCDGGTGFESFALTTDCPVGCENDACVQVCTPLEDYCEPATGNIYLCSSDGLSTTLTDECELGCTQQAGDDVCNPCEGPMCVAEDGSVGTWGYVVCAADGISYDYSGISTCGTAGCNEATGACDYFCEVNKLECDMNIGTGALMQCDNTGLSYASETPIELCEFGCTENLGDDACDPCEYNGQPVQQYCGYDVDIGKETKNVCSAVGGYHYETEYCEFGCSIVNGVIGCDKIAGCEDYPDTEYFCSGGSSYRCINDGYDKVEFPCGATGCDASTGQCTEVCQVGQNICDTAVIDGVSTEISRYCTDNLVWSDDDLSIACSGGCDQSTGECMQCNPGKSCVNGDVEVCSLTHEVTTTSCDKTYSPSCYTTTADTYCTECNLGSGYCDGSSVVDCPLGKKVLTQCGVLGCTEYTDVNSIPQARCNECTGTNQRCISGEIQTCTDGVYVSTLTCDYGCNVAGSACQEDPTILVSTNNYVLEGYLEVPVSLVKEDGAFVTGATVTGTIRPTDLSLQGVTGDPDTTDSTTGVAILRFPITELLSEYVLAVTITDPNTGATFTTDKNIKAISNTQVKFLPRIMTHYTNIDLVINYEMLDEDGDLITQNIDDSLAVDIDGASLSGVSSVQTSSGKFKLTIPKSSLAPGILNLEISPVRNGVTGEADISEIALYEPFIKIIPDVAESGLKAGDAFTIVAETFTPQNTIIDVDSMKVKVDTETLTMLRVTEGKYSVDYTPPSDGSYTLEFSAVKTDYLDSTETITRTVGKVDTTGPSSPDDTSDGIKPIYIYLAASGIILGWDLFLRRKSFIRSKLFKKRRRR